MPPKTPKQCSIDYANKCECRDDDNCGCTYPNNCTTDIFESNNITQPPITTTNPAKNCTNTSK